MGDGNQVDLSVVIPMYNEEDNVVNTVAQVSKILAQQEDTWEVLIVNDGSIDRTLQMAQKLSTQDARVQVVSHPRNVGRGKALRTGFAHARGATIVTTDADLSYDPKYILDLVKTLKEDRDIDVTLGSPYMPGGETENVPAGRLLVSELGNKILGIAMAGEGRGRIHTITCVFRAYRRQVLDSLALESDGKEIHLEILSKAIAAGFRVKEVPAVLRGRTRGQSKHKVWRTVISHLLFSFYERPMMLFGIFGLGLLFLGVLAGLYLLLIWQQGNLSPTRPMVTITVVLTLAGLQMFSFGFLSTQLATLKRLIYKVQSDTQRAVAEQRGDK